MYPLTRSSPRKTCLRAGFAPTVYAHAHSTGKGMRGVARVGAAARAQGGGEGGIAGDGGHECHLILHAAW
jgi:hypothetical protein